MRGLLGLLTLAVCSVSYGQVPIRIPVRHADPWMIKAMLEGQKVTCPEISCFWINGAPQGMAASQAVNALFSGGTWMVCATDNSLWFIPDNKKKKDSGR